MLCKSFSVRDADGGEETLEEDKNASTRKITKVRMSIFQKAVYYRVIRASRARIDGMRDQM